MAPLSRQQKTVLISLCAIVFLISFAYSLYFHIAPAVDARAYDSIAWNIVSGHGYRENLTVPFALDLSIVRVGPGYELFLAALFYLFGHHYWPVWLMQALLVVASTLLMFVLSRELFRERWSFWGGIVSAGCIGLSPDLITIQSMLMSETLGMFLVIASVFLFVKMMRHRGFLFPLLTGLVLAAAITVRTPALFLLIPIVFYLGAEKRWRDGLLMMCAIVVVFAPWVTRNWQSYHAFIPTNLAGGFNLVTGNHPGADGEQGPYPLFDTWANASPRGYVAADARAASEFKQFVFEHPLSYLRLTLTRTIIYFSIARPTGFWFHLSGFSKMFTLVSSALYTFLLFVLGSLGIAHVRKLPAAEKKRAYYVLAMLVLMPLSLVGIIVETRYRMLVYPFFALFAGYGFELIRERRHVLQPLVIILALFFTNTAVDIALNWSRIIEKVHGL